MFGLCGLLRGWVFLSSFNFGLCGVPRSRVSSVVVAAVGWIGVRYFVGLSELLLPRIRGIVFRSPVFRLREFSAGCVIASRVAFCFALDCVSSYFGTVLGVLLGLIIGVDLFTEVFALVYVVTFLCFYVCRYL